MSTARPQYVVVVVDGIGVACPRSLAHLLDDLPAGARRTEPKLRRIGETFAA